MTNYFDLENTTDLDEEVKGQLKTKNSADKVCKILDLFDIKSTLTIDEILVGLARKHGLKKKRSWVSNRLCALTKTAKIVKVQGGRSTYQKCPQLEGLHAAGGGSI